MRSCALKQSKRTYYEKQRGNERTIFKCMSLNDGEAGDIGFIYYSNLETATVKNLPILEEKIKFSEFKGLAIIGRPQIEQSMEMEVKVAPNEETIFLMRKTGQEQASYKVQFFPRLVYDNLCTPEEIRKMGKKSQIEEITSKGERIDRNQFTYIMQHDNGFAFLFENLENYKKLLIKLNFTIENLIDSEAQQEGVISDTLEWRVTLEPGQFKVKELKIADITNRTSLKYSFNFKNY